MYAFRFRASDDGPAVFVDLLAPPYSQEDPPAENHPHNHVGGGGHHGHESCGEEAARECDFFREIPSEDENVSWLQWIPPPTSYYCDSEEYRGPPLHCSYN